MERKGNHRFLHMDADRIFWISVTVILFLLHAGLSVDFGDDVDYAEYLNQYELWDYLGKCYRDWTSRLVIEAVNVLIAYCNPWVWKLFNIGMSLLLIHSMGVLFGRDNKDRLIFRSILCVSFWLIPIHALNGAGWEATTINYLWPFSLGVTGMIPIRRFLYEEKMSGFSYTLYMICLTLAANMELMTCVLFGFYFLFGIYIFLKPDSANRQAKKLPARKKQISLYVILLFLLIVSFGYIFACPGNKLRSILEMERFFPEFAEYGVGQKLWLGFLYNCHYYMGGTKCLIYPVFMIVLLGCFLFRKKYVRKQWASLFWFALPAFFSGLVMMAHLFLKLNWKLPGFFSWLEVFVKNQMIAGFSSFPAGQVVFQTVVYVLLLFMTAGSVYLLHGNTRETLLELTVLAAGFASRWVMGFSSTIFISGERTGLFCSLALLVVAARNIQLIFRESCFLKKIGI